MKGCQEALKAMDPDVFIGVEINDWDAFHEVCSVVPGLVVHVVSSFRDPMTGVIRPQQIGIASKLKCLGAGWEAWKANVPNISRGFSYTALENPAGPLLMVYGNHLKSNRGSNDPAGAKNVADMRNEQAAQLLSHCKEMAVAYKDHKIGGWVLGGDFNTNHDGQFPLCKVISILTTGGFTNTWQDVPKDQRLTWHPAPKTPFQATTFDYLLAKDLGPLKAELIPQPLNLSDHAAIMLKLPSAP